MNRMKFIAVACPTLGMVNIRWASALRSLALPLNTGYCEAFATDDVGGEIAEGRNACVSQVMSYESDKREITHIFWLDDDVICYHTAILALLRHNRDIAAGVYFSKGVLQEPLIFPYRFGGTAPFVPDQTMEVWGHGMGLTLVRLDVYKRLRDETTMGTDKYGRPQWYKTPGSADAEVVDGDVLVAGGTEDLYFLESCSKLGIKPLVDTSQHAFGWHYDANTKRTYPEKQFLQRKAGQPIVWDTPDGSRCWQGLNGQPMNGRPKARPGPAVANGKFAADETPHTILMGDR